MPHATDHITAVELAAMPDDGKRYELVEGILRMMSPAGGRHGRIASKLLTRLAVFVEKNNLGHTFAAETGFLIHQDPDTVRAPDVSYVSHARIGNLADHPGYLPLAPDVVAEVVSPNDTSSEVEQKATDWVSAGVQLVLVVDPQTRSIRQYRSAGEISVCTQGELKFAPILPGFALDVEELFA